MVSDNDYNPKNEIEAAILNDLRRVRIMLEQINQQNREKGFAGTDQLGQDLPHLHTARSKHRQDPYARFRQLLSAEFDDLKLQAIVGLPPERKEVTCPECRHEFKP